MMQTYVNIRFDVLTIQCTKTRLSISVSLDFICSPVCSCIYIYMCVHWGSMDWETSACAAKPLFHKDTLPNPQKEVLKPNSTSVSPQSNLFRHGGYVFSFDSFAQCQLSHPP